MKKINSLLLSLSLIFGAATLSSCSFIGDDPFSIDHITYEYDEEGNTLATIHYTESAEVPDVTIKINKGSTGNGVKEITSIHDENNNQVIITVDYTDPEMDPTIIRVPVKNGKDGAGLKDVSIEKDEKTGDTILIMSYTDGRENTKITIPKGEKGDKGDGIKDISYELDPITNETVVTIKMDNKDDLILKIPAGLNGIGILEITVKEETAKDITFEILFDDLKSTEITIQKSRATKWYSGGVNPADAIDILAESVTGDFYFNTSTGEISIKQEDGSWKFVFEYEGHGANEEKEKPVKVTLNLNGGELVDSSDLLQYKIAPNTTFTVPIPLAKKEGMTFDGWYTDPIPTPVSGKLTMNTIIVKNPDPNSNGEWTYYACFK